MENTNTMQVQVWSDVMCPFCYIGKRHFEKALAQFTDKEHIDIEWKSFQLDPTLPQENTGEDAYEYLSKRKGISKQQVEQMHVQVTKMAQDAGLEYHLDKTPMVNSFKAHRLIQMAKEKGLGDKAEELLFYANFTQSKDFSNTGVLTDLGIEIGLSATDVEKALTDELYAGKVNRDINEAQHLGIRGVPFFVFNNRYGVSGAQPAEVFLQVLEKTYAEWKQAHQPIQVVETTATQSCTVDGNDC